jgi:tellurite resistance protein TerB
MSFFDDAFDALKDGVDKVITEGKKFTNKSFLKATVAACVRVADADGNIDSDEKKKTLGVIQRNQHLKVFKSKDVVKIFNECTDHLEFDKTIGIGELDAMIVPLKGKPEAALLVRICCAIGEADGTFDDDEKKVVKEIANLLDVPISF